jgi:hypothetical protein
MSLSRLDGRPRPAPTPDLALQTPALQAPALQTPALQTPALQTPALQTPALRTPALRTPCATPPVGPSAPGFAPGQPAAAVGARLGAMHGLVAAARSAVIGLMMMGTLGGVAADVLAATQAPHRAPAAATAPAESRSTPILFFGLNPTATYERDELAKRLGADAVTLVAPGKVQGEARVGGQRFDLARAEDRLALGRALGIDAARTTRLAAALEGADPAARDELASLAQRLLELEGGRVASDRLVISGHNAGNGPWGDHNGSVSWDTLAEVVAIFPGAAARVQDLHVAACYSGDDAQVQRYRDMFPNLKTVWAYEATAPGAASGAVAHLLRWERATRGDQEALTRDAARGTRKGENVAVWTRAGGLETSRGGGTLARATERYEASRPVLAQYLSGAREVRDAARGPLRDHLDDLDRLLARQDVPAAQRPALEAARGRIEGLLRWPEVVQAFGAAHRDAVHEALASLGLPAPALETLSRRDALALASRVEAAVAARGTAATPAQARAAALLGGLRDLSPAVLAAAGR